MQNKIFIVFIYSLISLGILFLSLFASTFVFEQWYGIILGILLMLIAIPFHIKGKKYPYLYTISIVLNSIANGCSLSALYLVNGIELDIPYLLLALLPAVGVMMLTCFLFQKFSKKISLVTACVLNLLIILLDITFWIINGNIFFSFCFFSTLIAFFYLCAFGITVGHDERLVLSDISFACFGSFIILTVVVIFILSEGDLLDGIDLSGESKKKLKKQK